MQNNQRIIQLTSKRHCWHLKIFYLKSQTPVKHRFLWIAKKQKLYNETNKHYHYVLIVHYRLCTSFILVWTCHIIPIKLNSHRGFHNLERFLLRTFFMQNLAVSFSSIKKIFKNSWHTTTEKKIVTSSIATNHISVRQCLHFGLTNENACLMILGFIDRLNFNVNILSWENSWVRSRLSFDFSKILSVVYCPQKLVKNQAKKKISFRIICNNSKWLSLTLH